MDSLASAELGTGLALGLGAACLVLGGATVSRRRGWRQPLPIGGVAFAVAGLVAAGLNGPLAWTVVVGVVGVGGAVEAARRARLPAWAAVAAAVPFAGLMAASSAVPDLTWCRLLVVAAGSVGAAAAAVTDDRWRHEAAGPGLLALFAIGVYLAVPDTEQAVALVAVGLVLACLGWPWRLASLGRGGTAASVALVTYTAAVGATGRPASLVGAVACMALLVGGALGSFVLPRVPTIPASWPAVPMLLATQLALVLVISRTVGLMHRPLAAATLAGPLCLAALVAGAVIRPPSDDSVPSLGGLRRRV